MIVYIRPDGSHFHISRDCAILKSGNFERLGYYSFELETLDRKKYRPCGCVIGSRHVTRDH